MPILADVKQEVLVFDPQGRDRFISLEEFEPTAAAVCFLRKYSLGSREVLLIKRGKDPGLGLWSLPGGKKEIEDGEMPIFAYPQDWRRWTIKATGAREFEEETGLMICPDDLGGLMVGFCYPDTGHRVAVLDGSAGFDDATYAAPLTPGKNILAVGWFSSEMIEEQRLKLTSMAAEVLPFYFTV